jgi:hypothetical protein
MILFSYRPPIKELLPAWPRTGVRVRAVHLMNPEKRVGRWVGILLLVQMVLLTVGFIVLKPGIGTDYLEVSGLAEVVVRAGVLLLLGASAVALTVAVLMYSVVSGHCVRLAVALVAVSVIWVVVQAADNVFVLAMLGLSKNYLAAAGGNAEIFNVVGAELRLVRSSAHYSVLLAIDAWFAVFFATLFKHRLVPRVIAGFGLGAIAVHIVGIPMSHFVGYPLFMPVGYGIAVSYLLVGGWLVAKGFRARVASDEGRVTSDEEL